MKKLKQFSFVMSLVLLLGACQTGTVGTGGVQYARGAGENIEVRADEYDQMFQYQYAKNQCYTYQWKEKLTSISKIS